MKNIILESVLNQTKKVLRKALERHGFIVKEIKAVTWVVKAEIETEEGQFLTVLYDTLSDSILEVRGLDEL